VARWLAARITMRHSFSPIFLGLRVSVGVPGKLQPPQPRQKQQQTIRDHESTLGHHKKLPARK
jgi:hypothetical protein